MSGKVGDFEIKMGRERERRAREISLPTISEEAFMAIARGGPLAGTYVYSRLEDGGDEKYRPGAFGYASDNAPVDLGVQFGKVRPSKLNTIATSRLHTPTTPSSCFLLTSPSHPLASIFTIYACLQSAPFCFLAFYVRGKRCTKLRKSLLRITALIVF